jgi:hypothetical protein
MTDATQIDEINVKEALERLSLPGFFSDEARMEAYFIVMEKGNEVQKIVAAKTVEHYPLSENIFATAEGA